MTSVALEHERTGQHATCATLAEADATLTRWSWSEGGESAGPAEPDNAYGVVQWADGTRLVVNYALRHDAERAPADLGAAIHAQCEYSAGRRRPPDMTPDDYHRLIARAGRETVERYERMLDTLEM